VVGLNESLPGRIFISYRRRETAWPAGRLYDVLVEHFPPEQVFKDVDNIEPGEDFVERITAAVESCDVLLALIGPQWLTITNKQGQRRLDDPHDYVRLEIETAITRRIRVIPILVDEAQMPGADELPASLAPLARRNAVEISPLTFDTKRLISTVHKTLAALKISDTATGSAAPTSTARPDRSNQQVTEPEVGQLYDQALAAFWTEQWDKAVDLLGKILSRQADYADAARKLELARRQQQLASHYAEASAAADAGNWEQAVAEYTMITDSDPDYRDTNSRLAEARHQEHLVGLVAEAHRLHRAGQWAAVIKVGEQLQVIDPSATDPDGLITSARNELAAEQRAAKLAADYHTGLHLFDAGRWEEAVEALEQVTRLDSEYQDAPALLDRARRELEQAAAAAAEEQARGPAEEQAPQAEEELWRDAEERVLGRLDKRPTEDPAPQQAEEPAEEQARRQAEKEDWQRSEKETWQRSEERLRQRAEERALAREQRGPTQPKETLPKLYEPVQQDRMNEERSEQIKRPQVESRKGGRLVSRVALMMLGLVVVVTIGVAVWSHYNTYSAYDKLLSHLPASERSTCQSTYISPEQLAAALCSAGTYGLWNDTDDARLDYNRQEGDCTRSVPAGGAYQHWANKGRSGILNCSYAGRYAVEWSIDELDITGTFYSDSDYQDLLSEALKIRGEVK
jgi:outer membrane protein assembly factor BamD (BamD/ComL family)